MENNLDDLNKKVLKDETKGLDNEKLNEVSEIEQVEEVNSKEKKEEIVNLQEQNDKTIKALNETRKGLPVTDEQTELPRSVIENNKKIEKLSNELETQSKDEKNNEEGSEKIEVEEFKMEKVQADKFADTVQGLINVFKKRKAERLSLVIEDSGVSRLIAGVNGIKDVISKNEYNQDDIDIELNKIAGAISSIGEVPRQSGMRENPDTLRAIGFHLNKINDQGKSLISYLSKFSTSQTEKTRKIIHKIGRSAEDKRLFLARKNEALARYRGR